MPAPTTITSCNRSTIRTEVLFVERHRAKREGGQQPCACLGVFLAHTHARTAAPEDALKRRLGGERRAGHTHIQPGRDAAGGHKHANTHTYTQLEVGGGKPGDTRGRGRVRHHRWLHWCGLGRRRAVREVAQTRVRHLISVPGGEGGGAGVR